jgi:hypothetical protein
MSASVSAVGTQLRSDRASLKGASFISTLQFNQVLRVCNAYPYEYPLDVYVGKEKLTETALAYKKCGEFQPTLKAGDKIDFKVGDSGAGSFSVAELPSNDATLVLVIYRHDAVSTGVSFESHVFSNLLNSQVAVVDTYKGAAKATPRIQDTKAYKKEQRSEELRYNSVVAVNPGLYEVLLEGPDGKIKAQHQLVALNKESYMIMRCGVEATQGKSYPEELMIFPESDRKALPSAAPVQPMFVTMLATLFATVAALAGA